MKKSEIKKILKEELKSYKKDHFQEIASWPIKDVSFSDIRRVTKHTPALPYEPGQTLYIPDEATFKRWKDHFIKFFGSAGNLRFGKVSPSIPEWTSFTISNNDQWETRGREERKAIGQYYREKGSGGYTGD